MALLLMLNTFCKKGATLQRKNLLKIFQSMVEQRLTDITSGNVIDLPLARKPSDFHCPADNLKWFFGWIWQAELCLGPCQRTAILPKKAFNYLQKKSPS